MTFRTELQLQSMAGLRGEMLLHASISHCSLTAPGFYFWNFLFFSYLEIHLFIGGGLSLERDKAPAPEGAPVLPHTQSISVDSFWSQPELSLLENLWNASGNPWRGDSSVRN